MSMTLLLSGKFDNIWNQKLNELVEGEDYFKENVIIMEKKYDQNFRITSAPVGSDSIAIFPRIKDEYYFIGDDGEYILTKYEIYSKTRIGDNMTVYRSKNGGYYTSLNYCKSQSLDSKFRVFMFIASFIPIAGIYIFIMTIISRKSMVNPYYNAFYNGEFL